jgi:cytochrome c
LRTREAVAAPDADQKLRRFRVELTGSLEIDPDCKSPQISTAEKSANTANTAAQTTIESTGIATSCFGFKGSMPSGGTKVLMRIKFLKRKAALTNVCLIHINIKPRASCSETYAKTTSAAGPRGMKAHLCHIGLAVFMMSPALALSPAEQRGKTFALNNCARCHSIDRASQSALKIAPPFRTLHLRYPIESIAEALAEGIATGHPTMPQFQLDPDQIHDLLSYLKTLE